MNIYEKLQVIQGSLVAPKGQYNSFGKYKYRSCEDILEALKPLLGHTKTALTIRDEVIFFQTETFKLQKDDRKPPEDILCGQRFYIKATVRLTDCEKEDSFLEVFAFAREEDSKKGMDGAQVTGAASSYARKYALNGMFCIDDNKDADSTNAQGKEGKKKVDLPPESPPTTKEPVTQQQIKAIHTLLASTGTEKSSLYEAVSKQFGVAIKSTTELTTTQASWAIEILKEKKERMGGVK